MDGVIEILKMVEIVKKMTRKILKLESKTESDYVDYVKKRGFYALKINKRSWPDRLTILLNGYGFYIEFKRNNNKFGKREGEKYQAYTHNQLRKRGFHVYLVDNLEHAKAIFEYELAWSKAITDKFVNFKEYVEIV